MPEEAMHSTSNGHSIEGEDIARLLLAGRRRRKRRLGLVALARRIDAGDGEDIDDDFRHRRSR